MTSILQFGTSRLLQAHADLFIDEARAAGQDIGPITVVKTTPGTERHDRLQALTQGFPIRIRGLAEGQTIDRTQQVRSVTRALDAATEWPEVVAAFVATDLVISNTAERGFDLMPGDDTHDWRTDTVPAGFPAKLLTLLAHRHARNARPLLILPTELHANNGQVLASILARLAADWAMPPDFRAWLERDVECADTLVDRIVSEAIEPAGAVTEPYALWAIRQPRLPMPFTHAAITVTDDLTPYMRLKLHILNQGHSFLAGIWLHDHRPADETVLQILSDPLIRARLDAEYQTNIIPGFAKMGMEAAARAYVAQTMERFLNPFLRHRLSDIAQNHGAKVRLRIDAFHDWVNGRG